MGCRNQRRGMCLRTVTAVIAVVVAAVVEVVAVATTVALLVM
jgi:hypothetical protein